MRFSTKFISSSAVLLAASMVKETTADSAVYAAKGEPYTVQIITGTAPDVGASWVGVTGEADCKVAAEQLNKATPLSAPNLVECGMSFAGTTLPLPKTCSRTLMGCFAPAPRPP